MKTSAEKSKEWRKNNPDKVKAYKERTKERKKVVSKKYYEKNKERLKEGKSNWYQKNKKEIRKHENEYRQNNKEKISLRNKKYKKDFPEKIKECIDKRHFRGMRIKALERDNFACQVCGMTEEEHLKKWNYSLTVHHKDGNGWGKKNKNNALDNLQTLCKIHHGKAHGRGNMEFKKNSQKEQLPKKTKLIKYPSKEAPNPFYEDSYKEQKEKRK